MANVDSAFGLRPVRYLSGAPYNGACRRYYVDTAGSNLFIGDPVIVQGTGQSDGTADVGIATGGASNYITGVIVGFDVANDSTPNLNTIYMASGASGYVFVADDPDLLFEIQEDSVGSTLDSGAVSEECVLVSGTGSTTTGLSGWELDSSSAGSDNGQVQIVELAHRSDNEIGANAKWLVKIMLHSYRSTDGV
jgi:hypothetical protein